MAAFGVGLILFGIVTFLAGIGGFVDTRKVDRRYRTGYKNNEPDNRNFRRAGKRVLYGIGIVIVGAAANSLTESKRVSPLPSATDSVTAPVEAPADDMPIGNMPVPKESSVSTDQVALKDTAPATISSTHQEAFPSNEPSYARQTAASISGEPPVPAINAGGRTYSDNEIAQMEEEKQYHGDDPLVRRRLGLPSRDTKKLIP